jgi:hypothetical protein
LGLMIFCSMFVISQSPFLYGLYTKCQIKSRALQIKT